MLDEQHYERIAKKLPTDETTYRKLDHNPFPAVIQELNQRFTFAKDERLLTIREFQHLFV